MESLKEKLVFLKLVNIRLHKLRNRMNRTKLIQENIIKTP